MDTVLCSIHAVEDHEPDFQKEVSELNSLIGLSVVKKELYRIINLAMADMLRRQQDLKTSRQSYHMVFSGNPGTGKTTVARLLAKIFRGLGVLSKGHLVEVGWPNLCADNAMQTAEKTRKVMESALSLLSMVKDAVSKPLPGLKIPGDFKFVCPLSLHEMLNDQGDLIDSKFARLVVSFLESDTSMYDY